VTRALRRRISSAQPDSGMTLIELMFAMVIFAVVAAGALAGLVAADKTTRGDRNHVAAGNLAARELEISRNEFGSSAAALTTFAAGSLVTNPHPLPGGTAGSALVLDNVPFTVVRSVEWLAAGAGKSACDGGATATFPSLAVQVDVSWPQMDGSPHVISNTLLTPSKDVLKGGTLGFAAIKVLDYKGLPAEGRTVQLSGPGGTFTEVTADDGCAVFSTTVGGAYTASLNTSGYVDSYLVANPSKPVTVTVGSLSQATFSYDRSVTFNVTATTTGGFSLPLTMPGLTFSNAGLLPVGVKLVPSTGSSTNVTGLWPFVAPGYSVWSGTCTQSDPAAAGGTRPAGLYPTPGSSASTTVTLAPVLVTVLKGGLPLINATVTASPVSTAGCTGVDASPLSLGTTDSLGTLRTSLPAGSWKVMVSSSVVTTPVLLPTSGPTAITVVVP